MLGLEEGIECIGRDGTMLFLLCCRHNCLSVLQQLMEINRIKAKLRVFLMTSCLSNQSAINSTNVKTICFSHQLFS